MTPDTQYLLDIYNALTPEQRAEIKEILSTDNK
jgi:Spy/CpxP family protein refolding chaperone